MKIIPVLLSSLFFVACKENTKQSSANTDPTSEAQESASASSEVIIETSLGTIRAKLHHSSAPITVENFLSYVDQKHYDGTIFHRVISNFMIQGGGFEMSGQFPKEKETGEGITNESSKSKSNQRGTLSMARTNDPNSATAQFFINVQDNNNLDYPSMGGYAVFGEVTEGMEIVDAIKEVPTGTSMALSLLPNGRYSSSPFNDVPKEPVIIQSIRRAPSDN